MNKSKWKVMSILLIVVFALVMVFPAVSTAKDYKFAISQGWLDNDSGQNMNKGCEQGLDWILKSDGREKITLSG